MLMFRPRRADVGPGDKAKKFASGLLKEYPKARRSLVTLAIRRMLTVPARPTRSSSPPVSSDTPTLASPKSWTSTVRLVTPLLPACLLTRRVRAELDQEWELNYTTILHLSKPILTHFKKQNKGAFVRPLPFPVSLQPLPEKSSADPGRVAALVRPEA